MLIARFGAFPLHWLVKKIFASRTLVGAIALLSVGILPAQAEELKDWQYDVQTRSLTFTLPDSVMPLISVVSPDQLVLELPDTQVGDVMGQSIRDGLVESIVLEQATPETVWVVMDFAAGTVLADSQDATLLAEIGDGERQWQVRPALVAASRRAASQSVARADIPTGIPVEAAASELRLPAPATAQSIAQSSDLRELPVLEPAVPMNEPVSVPPLNALPIPTNDAATPSVVVPPLEEATASAPLQLPVPEVPVPNRSSEENFPVFSVEVIPAVPPVAIEPESAEPSFLGDFDDDSQSVPVQPLPNEPPVASQPVPDDIIASGTESIEPVPAASATIEPVTEAVAVDPIQSAPVSRWPEPIPFGQPLPR